MKRNLRLAIGQVNCTVGDFEGNCAKIINEIEKARSAGADIISFPELAIPGYPPEDLLLKAGFIEDNMAALKRIVRATSDIVVITGYAQKIKNKLYNAAAVIYDGDLKGSYQKMLLPNYGVFDEKRYFYPGTLPAIFKIGDVSFGVNICEDIWHKEGPAAMQAAAGASFIINISSSPYHYGRIEEREGVICRQAKENGVFISYANIVGGQDELVFDGHSMIVAPSGKLIDKALGFKEDLLVADIEITVKKSSGKSSPVPVCKKFDVKTRQPLSKKHTKQIEPTAEIYDALTLGLKDYVKKNGFSQAVIGMSGGIDSSLVAAIAVDALGKDNIIGVFMPTHYSSPESEKDAKTVAEGLGMKFVAIPMEQVFKLYLLALESQFAGRLKDTTEENLQARIRGNMLMALSNKFGWIVLTTGNKSEMSTGYATLYGDMAGGFAVIKDVPKTLVYKLVRYRNSISSVIPDSVITKEPTAELRHNQKDRDTLPPYETLDPVLKAYVEEDKTAGQIVSMGFKKDVVLKVINMVDRNEYKRRQAPPGVKITPKAFGKDRRMPITNKYKSY